MRVVVFEHFSSIPLGAAAALVAEGRAMRDAVAADLARVPGLEVDLVRERGRLRAAVRRADAALVIAPEQGGCLERLCRVVEVEGRLLLGPSAAVARLAADKLATARCLAAAGLPTPVTESVPFAEARHLLRGRTGPFVIKPRDGCGGQGVALVRRPSEIDAALGRARRAAGLSDLLVQAFVPGVDASVSVLAGRDGLLTLGLGRQHVRRGGTFAYRGGEIPWSHRLEREARDLARAAVKALAGRAAGLRGYIGVDLVLGRNGPVVIEVNPRLTTSYIGLRRVVRENLSGLIVAAAAGRPLPRRVTILGRCRFRADGKASVIGGGREGRWPATISAGTSAASI